MKIALGTGEREIVGIITSAVLARNDMFNLQGDERRIGLPSLAVFAAVACPFTDGSAASIAYGSPAVNRKRASACRIASSLFASI